MVFLIGRKLCEDAFISTFSYNHERVKPDSTKSNLRADDRQRFQDMLLRWYDTPQGEASKFETGAAQLSSRGVAVFAKSLPTYRAAEPPVESPVPLLVFAGFGSAHPSITGDRAFRRALDFAIA